MDVFILVFKNTVSLFLSALTILMFARAILGWFLREEESKVLVFLISVTEPVIYPVRALCGKFGWFESIPIDIPFMITFVLLSMMELFLSAYSGI